MFRFIGRIGCLAVIVLAIFAILAFLGGGEQFRSMGRKAGGTIQKAADKIGEQADDLKKKGEGLREKAKRWTKKDWVTDDK